MDKRLTPAMVAALQDIARRGFAYHWDLDIASQSNPLFESGLIANRNFGYAWILTDLGRAALAAMDGDSK